MAGFADFFGGGPQGLLIGAQFLSGLFNNFFGNQGQQQTKQKPAGFGVGVGDTASGPATQSAINEFKNTVGQGINAPGGFGVGVGMPPPGPRPPRRRQQRPTSTATAPSRGDKQIRISTPADPPELASFKESIGREALQNVLTLGSPAATLSALGGSPERVIGDFIDMAISATGSTNPDIIRPIVEQFIMEATINASVPQEPQGGAFDTPDAVAEFFRSLGIDPVGLFGTSAQSPQSVTPAPPPLFTSLSEYQFNPNARFGFSDQTGT